MRRDSLRITRYHILEKGYIIEKECDCLKKEQELESVFKAIIFISQQYHFIMHGTGPDEGIVMPQFVETPEEEIRIVRWFNEYIE